MENCGKPSVLVLLDAGLPLVCCGPQSVPSSPRLQLCSACTGDYEDPDRSAWPAKEVAVDEFAEDELVAEELFSGEFDLE